MGRRLVGACQYPGCPALARSGWCPVHQPAPRAHREIDRVRGRQVQTLRRRLFDCEPLCRRCLDHGYVRIATIRDHVVPLWEGGEDTAANTQPLCAECHADKTRVEAGRRHGPRGGA